MGAFSDIKWTAEDLRTKLVRFRLTDGDSTKEGIGEFQVTGIGKDIERIRIRYTQPASKGKIEVTWLELSPEHGPLISDSLESDVHFVLFA